MKLNSHNTKIIIRIIAAISAITIAVIKFYPWNKQLVLSKEKVNKEYKFTGTLVDETSNESIPGAVVTVVGRNEHFYSEQNGNFKLDLKDSVKNIRVRIVKAGYVIFDESYDLPEQGVTIPLKRVIP